MNQNYQSPENDLFFTPVKKNAAYYRRRARESLAGKWKIAILVSFLAILLGAASSGFSFSLNVKEEELHEFARIGEAALPLLLPFLAAAGTFALLTNVAVALFVSGPAELGYHRFHLELIDRNDAAVRAGTLFRFFSSHYFKGVLLRLLRGLISLLTSIPLIFATLLAFFQTITAYVLSPTPETLILSILSSSLTVFAGAVITLLISLPISYMYVASPFIMAEYPEISAIEAMRNSRHLMRGHKWKLFCLDLSFIGWMLLGALAFGIGIIFVLPYVQTARALFYNDIAGRETAKEAEFPSLDPDDYIPNDSKEP